MGRKSLYALILRAPLCGANKNINNPQVRHLGSLGWLSLALEPCLGGDLWGAIQAAGGR